MHIMLCHSEHSRFAQYKLREESIVLFHNRVWILQSLRFFRMTIQIIELPIHRFLPSREIIFLLILFHQQ